MRYRIGGRIVEDRGDLVEGKPELSVVEDLL